MSSNPTSITPLTGMTLSTGIIHISQSSADIRFETSSIIQCQLWGKTNDSSDCGNAGVAIYRPHFSSPHNDNSIKCDDDDQGNWMWRINGHRLTPPRMKPQWNRRWWPSSGSVWNRFATGRQAGRQAGRRWPHWTGINELITNDFNQLILKRVIGGNDKFPLDLNKSLERRF